MSVARNSTAIATTATAEGTAPPPPDHVGRFAPSPSGELHLGSLYTAAASYLEARAHHGRWLVRIEDVDAPRVVPGAAQSILRTLASFGFEWDGEIVHQSGRTDAYAEALRTLRGGGHTFECSCSRAELAAAQRYPGHCRNGPTSPSAPTATRLRIEPGYVHFTDGIQGGFRQDVAAAVGDLVLRRRDGWFAYALAVVVDDHFQGITHVVRGADLLDNTPRQMLLQRALGIASPRYFHVPVLLEPGGGKLSKSERAVDLDAMPALPQLVAVFTLLGLSPPLELLDGELRSAWTWAVERWSINRVPKRLTLELAT